MQAVFGRWAELVGPEVAAHTTPGVVRRRQARRAHRLDRLGDPAAPARAHRRTPSQRGARPRHGHPDRGAGPARAVAGRRAGSARATVAVRATPTAERERRGRDRSLDLPICGPSPPYRDLTAPLYVASRAPAATLRGSFLHRSPRAPGCPRGSRPSEGYHGDRVAGSSSSDPEYVQTWRRPRACRPVKKKRTRVSENPDQRLRPLAPATPRSPSPAPTAAPPSPPTTTPRRSRSSRASRRCASARACTSAPPASAACTT